MDFLRKIKLIQGGMGVYVSNWRLAGAVARERPGLTAGTVSGTALDSAHVRLLQLGDPGGHIRRALAVFDSRFGTHTGKNIIDRYFIEGGKAPSDRFKNSPAHIVRPVGGKIPAAVRDIRSGSISLSIDDELVELLIATAFAEVWLAKKDHPGKIFINFLKKIELPLVYAMYGAMLAGVDGIVVGAGNPQGLPAVRSHLVKHEHVETDLTVLYRETGESFILPFDPARVADGRLAQNPLEKPAFLAIASLHNLVETLSHNPDEAPDGFIIEHHTAGGHNAGPQGPLTKDALGQPVYGPDDEPDMESVRNTGVPFWMAGGYGSREKLQQALALGAAGVQVGSAFALAEESGLKPVYRTAVLDEIKNGKEDSDLVLTTFFSPTGYPFKVARLDGTLSDEDVYAARRKICDLGLLQQRGLGKPGEDGSRPFFQRCQASPLEDFIARRGLPGNTLGKRCLCNGLLSAVGLSQITKSNGLPVEEPAVVTLGNHLDGIRRLSRSGQAAYWAADVVSDILGET